MSEYLKLFENYDEYRNEKDMGHTMPVFSHCIEEVLMEVRCMPTIRYSLVGTPTYPTTIDCERDNFDITYTYREINLSDSCSTTEQIRNSTVTVYCGTNEGSTTQRTISGHVLTQEGLSIYYNVTQDRCCEQKVTYYLVGNPSYPTTVACSAGTFDIEFNYERIEIDDECVRHEESGESSIQISYTENEGEEPRIVSGSTTAYSGDITLQYAVQQKACCEVSDEYSIIGTPTYPSEIECTDSGFTINFSYSHTHTDDECVRTTDSGTSATTVECGYNNHSTPRVVNGSVDFYGNLINYSLTQKKCCTEGVVYELQPNTTPSAQTIPCDATSFDISFLYKTTTTDSDCNVTVVENIPQTISASCTKNQTTSPRIVSGSTTYNGMVINYSTTQKACCEESDVYVIKDISYDPSVMECTDSGFTINFNYNKTHTDDECSISTTSGSDSVYVEWSANTGNTPRTVSGTAEYNGARIRYNLTQNCCCEENTAYELISSSSYTNSIGCGDSAFTISYKYNKIFGNDRCVSSTTSGSNSTTIVCGKNLGNSDRVLIGTVITEEGLEIGYDVTQEFCGVIIGTFVPTSDDGTVRLHMDYSKSSTSNVHLYLGAITVVGDDETEEELDLLESGLYSGFTSGETYTIRYYTKHGLGIDMFLGCTDMTAVRFTYDETTMETRAFYGCTSLSRMDSDIDGVINIPSSVSGFGYGVFEGCTSIQSVNIPSGVTQMGHSVFKDCHNLERVKMPTKLEINSESSQGIFGNCYKLTSVGEMGSNASVEIPTGVTIIPSYTFGGCSGLTIVEIPDYITSIGVSAFQGCTSLPTVDIPSSVTNIGNRAFASCTSLSSVTIPDSVTNIGFEAFANCSSLTSVTIPDSVTSISDATFNHCTSLTSVTIPDSVTSIGNSAFYQCSSLPSVTIPDSVTRIGEHAFANCSDLTSVTIPDSVTSIGPQAFIYCTSLSSVTIPDSVNGISFGTFHSCTSLTSVTIPDSVTSIGHNAFYGCSSLPSVTIPDSVTSIDTYAFAGCSGLTSINIPNSVTSIGNGTFYDCSGLTSVTIPDSVTSISNDTFSVCTSLSSVTIPDSVTRIGEHAFNHCTSLTSVTIPDSVTSIGKEAFQDCYSLSSIEIPNSVKTITSGVFLRCTSLSSVTIPDSVTSIGGSVFAGCSSLTTIDIPSSVTSIGDSAFAGSVKIMNYNSSYKFSLKLFNTPNLVYLDELNFGGKANTTTISSTYNHFRISGITFGGEIVTIPNLGMKNTYLSSVIIGSGVTSIGNSAFSGCTSLTSVTIPDSVTSIGERAFYLCANLPSINIPSGVTSIGNQVFQDCHSLTSITIPNSVISIGQSAFSGCTSLPSITIPNSVTSIDNYAFEGCTRLTSVTIPDSVTSIGGSVFSGCTSLPSIGPVGSGASVEIPDSVNGISNGTFAHCSNLTSVTIPDSVTSIGERAFAYCSNLPSIDIPSGVTSIGSSAFTYCSKLTSCTIGSGVTSIGQSAFYYCANLTSCTIGSGVTSIGQSAFNQCNSLASIVSNATIAPTISSNTFERVKAGGTLTVPSGSSGYDVWMQNANYYLGFYNWTKVEQ